MSRIRRAIWRIGLHLLKVALIPLENLNPRAYMKLYVPILSAYGLHLNGFPRYISLRARFDDFEHITLGERTVISKYVILLTHDYSLTTALIAIGEPPSTDIAIKREIKIGSNVFIGMNAVILPGTQIGDDVIVGAGSVVRGIIPSDSIVVGNPAERVGSLRDHPERWRERREGSAALADWEFGLKHRVTEN
ncbi:acyltransferase [Bradyrhizobium sp. 38]|uniref:acyltransferase n=1 Tax=unclassified Bradyrhizobium TaxID=2631580 RepID=UPI001FFBFD84|nr:MULTISPECIES: acyltransferase [unclassified Bradyrhizobium]MCK1341635.1 acyltransferase [Bradyrhizobium sp. 38]MCK1778834.1 acyltransferase [Bradyrhizobium sp. 132]